MPVAVITGAGRGIGAACARALAAAGWNLVLVDRCKPDPLLPYALATPDDLAGVVIDCGGGERALGIEADVRDQAGLDAAVDAAVERFGGLDAAVAAAGCISGGARAWETGDDMWTTAIGVNLEGVWRLSQAAVPALLARPEPRHGRFVAISSSGGTDGLPLLAAYVAAKHGVNGFIRSLAADLGPFGITANAVAPGSTRTAMLEASAAVYDLESVEGFTQHHLLGRLLEPEEVAALVAWVCGPTSGGVTGAILPVDAGFTA
jgi:SDR family mycofactocin-dependent oxidoreductase